jgi:hypothetical protein
MISAADITALRAQACDLIAALGAVCDKLAIGAETLRVPSKSAPEIDALVISEHLSHAAESAERLAAEASDFAQVLDLKQHQEDAPCHA